MGREFHLTEVKTKKDIREFHDLPSQIYRGDSNWIKPLTKEIETVFNSFAEHAVPQRRSHQMAS